MPRQSECIRGHDLTDENNLRWRQRKDYRMYGIRFRWVFDCRKCHSIHTMNSRKRKKTASADRRELISK